MSLVLLIALGDFPDPSHLVVTVKSNHKSLVPGAEHLGCEVVQGPSQGPGFGRWRR